MTPIPVNLVEEKATEDATGRIVDVVPVVESIDPDAIEVEIAGGPVGTDETGRPVDALPVRIVTGPTTLASGAFVDPIPVSIIGGGDSGLRSFTLNADDILGMLVGYSNPDYEGVPEPGGSISREPLESTILLYFVMFVDGGTVALALQGNCLADVDGNVLVVDGVPYPGTWSYNAGTDATVYTFDDAEPVFSIGESYAITWNVEEDSNNILLESGDDLLLESGDNALTEYA